MRVGDDDAGLRVADDTAREGPGAKLEFVVTLDRSRESDVTVKYATSDGTAMAPDDYTDSSGTLTIPAGDRRAVIEVPVADDDLNDDRETLALTLGDPEGAVIDYGEAIGTTRNRDAMPRAWRARFGRTVAEQVMDAVEDRLRAAGCPEAVVSLGGERIGLGPLSGARRNALVGDDAGAATLGEAAARASHEAEAERGAADLVARLKGATDPQPGRADRGRSMTGRELLLGSSFTLTSGTAGEGIVSFWGLSAASRFDRREGALALDGKVTSVQLGTNWKRGPWTTGFVVARSVGDGGYRNGARGSGGGAISATVTGLDPWLRHALRDGLEAWGVAGTGAGNFTLQPIQPDGDSHGSEPLDGGGRAPRDARGGVRDRYRREPCVVGCEARPVGGRARARAAGTRSGGAPRARLLGGLLLGSGRG